MRSWRVWVDRISASEQEGCSDFYLNVETVSRIVHYIKILFPLFSFDFTSEESTSFYDLWCRARGHRVNPHFNEIYRVYIYDLCLLVGSPTSRQLEVCA